MEQAKRKPKKIADPLLLLPINEVLQSLGVQAEGWEVAIIGDGSGQGWDKSCGWCAVLHDHYANRRHEQHGANSCGTSNLAELLPYLFTMLWYSQGPGKSRLHDIIQKQPGNRLRVHIITDSELIANQGNGKAKRKAAGALWASFDHFEASGYKFIWHHLNRDKLGLNQLADHLSRQSRIAIAGAITALEEVEFPEDTDVYSFNPNKESDGKENPSPDRQI